MQKYLLVMIGDISTDVCQHLANELTPIVDSPRLKYQYSKGVVLFYFESDVDQIEIHEFIGIITYGLITTYILIKANDNMSVNMPKFYSDYLFDLETEEKKNEPEAKQEILIEYEEEDYSDNLALILEEIKSKVKKPSLDTLLDKIKLKGIGSLTQFEKDTLEEYSKK